MIVHVFIEKCSFLVDRLGCTSEFYIEVEQKGGGGGLLATLPCTTVHLIWAILLSVYHRGGLCYMVEFLETLVVN